MNHLEKIASKLDAYGLDAMLVTSEPGEFYAIGFHGEGAVVVGKQETRYFTDSRYIEAAEHQVTGAKITMTTRTVSQKAMVVQAVEEMGIRTVQHDVTMESLDACAAIANEADVVLVGSATINRDAPKAVWDVLGSIDAINTKGRAAGAFGAYGWSGEAPGMLQTRLGQLKFATPAEAFRVLFTPTQSDLDAMKDYARSVAALLK